MLLLYALARPILSTPAPSSVDNSTLFDPITGECDNINGCRTISQILWNCLSVIFICTWVAIHPNIPHVKAHPAVVTCCNILLMVLAMLAPELVILWAMRQRYSAKAIAEKFEKYGWGVPHGFLVIMGGLALYDGDEFCGYLWNDDGEGDKGPKNSVSSEVRDKIQKHHEMMQAALAESEEKSEEKQTDQPTDGSLETDETPLIENNVPQDSSNTNNLSKNTLLLEHLIKNGHIRISEDEILGNLSHSDSITKIIAVVQTIWFLMQVGARAMEGLAITELEIITVGFAVLNFGTYFLWWNKPLRVRYPVRVYWRQQVVPERPRKEKSNPNAMWISRVLGSIGDSIRKALDGLRKALAAMFNFFIFDGLNSDWENTDLTEAIVLNLVLLPFLPLVLVAHLVAAFINIIMDEDEDNMVCVVNSSRAEDTPATLFFVIYGITTFFGAIHCIPWNFQFPTHTEQLLWRISATALVAVPVAMGVVAILLFLVGALIESCWRSIDGAMQILAGIIDAFLLPVVYIAARITLMVLALMELRKLPPSAYQTVQWTTFIPHIG